MCILKVSVLLVRTITYTYMLGEEKGLRRRVLSCSLIVRLTVQDCICAHEQWRTEGGVWGVQTPPPEIPKALQKIAPNSTRFVKTVKKNC